jgi:lipopolysaccharide transport system permease protein
VAVADEWTIEPRGRHIGARLREVWVFRRLFRYFGRRALEKLYLNTFLGKAWIFIRPLFPLIVQTLIFGSLLGVQAPGVPYFLFLLVGSSVWSLFASCLMWGTRSMQINRGFLGRMYFPRIILPAATMSVAFVNFLIMMGVLVLTLGYYYVRDGRLYLASPEQMLWAIAALVLAVALALGISLFTAPMNLEYRDVRFTLMYVLDFWALLTPVLYPVSAVPERYQWLVFLNPVAAVVQGFKYGVLGIEAVNYTAFAVDVGIVIVVLSLGVWHFSRVEGVAVDRV